MLLPWPSVPPRLRPPQLRRQSCSLYPDSTSSTLPIAGIDILPRRSAHRDRLGDLLCWLSEALVFLHGGPYFCVSGIGNIDACIHLRCVPGHG
jgi:hypothetical protein